MNIAFNYGWLAAGALAGYLMGSIPFGLLIAKAKGHDLRQEGSKNIGATNVFRCVGKGWGVLALLLDALKGWVPAFLLPMAFARVFASDSMPEWTDDGRLLGLVFGVAAVVGHNWPVWLKFRGGKGVATSAGMLLGVAPGAVGIGLAVFAVTVVATRWVSLSSIFAALAVAGSGVWLYWAESRVLAVALIVVAAAVVWRHRANIGRLLRGEEPRIVGKK